MTAKVVDMQDEGTAQPYYKMLADHYAAVRDLRNAEKSAFCALEAYYSSARAVQILLTRPRSQGSH